MSVESPTRLAPLAQSIDNLPVLSRPNSQSPLPPMAIPTNASAATSTSTSAPEIHYVQPSSITLSPSVDAISAVTHLTASINADVEPDPQILEALRSKDRIYVLKLGESMESLINDRRIKIDLNPSTSYQRLLVHRCSAYYKLVPETDPTTKNILIYFRSESRIPARRISELVPAEESSQPAFQIMRRIDRSRGRQYSQPGSTAGEDADLSDVEPSETGSVGGRSNATGSSMKRFKTIEEREAAYLEARSRIFMGFEEKDKEKDKDMSANSSTFSLVSGSGSNSGGRSSIGDIDDSGSSAATESEWSGPATRDKRDSRRGVSVGSSSRSLRSSGASYNANGSGSSRNSRATSPSFTYASLYEPPPPTSYDPTQYNNPQAPPPGYIAHYIYPPYTPGPSQPYLGAFSFYPPYGYQPPPAHHSDPVTPAAGEPMYPAPQPAPQPVPFAPPYMWPHSPPPGQPPLPPHVPQHPPLNRTPNNSDTSSPTQIQNVQQYPYMQAAPHYNPYAPQGYYQPPPSSLCPRSVHLCSKCKSRIFEE
ncbi:hypothetical protein A0H81_06143 [Grifola frondosa]|uniref:SUZ domain-containing protein n=1 Tax=Grifola frondosa TaxID=5627 RepID=A0A1C7M9Y9_GRIFR|nr:hypothetical protein A0H81_06143 [Grifola frondosa]